MTTSADLKSQKISACLSKIYRLQTVDDLAITLMREIPKLVASDMTSYNEVNPQARRLIGVMDRPDIQLIVDKYNDAFEANMTSHPLIAHFEQASRMGVAKVSDFMPLDEWRQTGVFRHFYSHMGDLTQMVVRLSAHDNSVIALALNRLGRDFDEDDREILLLLHPHLENAYNNAVAYTQTLARVDAPHRALAWLEKAVLEVGPDMNLAYASPLAREFLQQAFPGHRQPHDQLPHELLDWIGRQINAARSGEPPPGSLARDGESGRISFRMVPGGEATCAILIEQMLTDTGADDLQGLGLSRREADTLFWLAEGKSNPEIAIILGISVTTVKKHVEAILRKLDVDNRTAAALKATTFLKKAQ